MSTPALPAWGSRLAYGGDYNPEQWPRTVWDEDIRLMRVAGVNTVTVGVFSWSSIEPREGEYTFGWLDDVLELMAEHAIHVVLATPTASPPPWFTLAHPEALPVTREGVRLVHGSRDTYNPAAPAYRAASRRVTRALAERYGRHPALALWHVHNEYGTVSYGPATDAAFRCWLRERYGDLDTLNATWNTPFWSQCYSAWEQIMAPQATQYLPNPSQVLDFKRFGADALRGHLRDQVAILRELSPGTPVTTNFMLPTWNNYDQWDLAADVDLVSIDHYLDDHGPAGETHVAFGADLARSFNGGRPWLLMEQATSLVYDYHGGRMLVKEPGRMRRNTLQYLARGAAGSLFFQWRSPLVGAEFFHSAMVPHTGPDSRIFREVVELGRTLDALAELARGPAGRRRVNDTAAAIVWDADAWWAADTPALPSSALTFLPAVRRVHAALWHLGINVDVVDPDADLSRYRLVLVPSMVAVSDAQARAFDTYVSGGGHLAVWYFSGTTDEHLRVRTGGYSGAFAHVLGVHVEEHFPQPDGAHWRLDDGSGVTGWAEQLRPRGAQVVARHGAGLIGEADGAGLIGGLPAGEPAITRNAYGRGVAHYLSTHLDDDALTSHLARVVAEAGVEPDHPAAGRGLEAVRRHAGADSYLFLVNHGPGPRDLDVDGTDLLTARPTDGHLRLAPGAAAVVREATSRPSRRYHTATPALPAGDYSAVGEDPRGSR